MTNPKSPAAFKLEWLKQMMRDDRMPLAQRAVGAHLFNYAEGDGTRVWPGRARLVAELGSSESTIDRALSALRDAGWIAREKRGSNTGRANMADVYRLTISQTAVLCVYEPVVDDAECPPDQSSTVTSAPHQPVVNGDEWSGVTTRQPCVYQSSSVRVPLVMDDDLPDHDQINNQIKSSFAHPGEEAQSATPVSAPAGAPHMDDEEFQKFWDVYPNRRDRKRAYPFFVEARKTASLDVIIAGAERYRDDPARDLTKDPKTWLSGECWEDEPIAARNAKTSSSRSWVDVARDLDAHEGSSVDAFGLPVLDGEVVEAPAPEPAPADVPALAVVEEDKPQDAFSAFAEAYPKRTPPSKLFGAQRAHQAAVTAHGERRVLLAAQRFTKYLEGEDKDPKYAPAIADWFKTDSFTQHLPHELEPHKGMNAVAWLDLVTERREIKIAKDYATGDRFQPEWPGDMGHWTKQEHDEFVESEKDRWFAEHRQMHLEVLTRRYGTAPAVAEVAEDEPVAEVAPSRADRCTVCDQKLLLKSPAGVCSRRDADHELARSQLIAA